MKKILLVEDDALIARIYTPKLEQAGFQVVVAEDGLVAMKLLPEFKPDLVVLDLIIPKLSGVDVLKFLRSRPDLESTRVIVFSNGFLQKLWEETAALGVQEMVLKSAVTPPRLIETISRVLDRPVEAVAGRTTEAAREDRPEQEQKRRSEKASGFRERIRRDFFKQIPAISKSLQQVCREYLEADASVRMLRLEAFRRKIGFLTHMTGMAGCYRIAQLSSAFEALLFELQYNPAAVSPASAEASARHTIASTVDLLAASLVRADEPDEQCLSPTSVLVVDDDVVSGHALALTLSRANLRPTTEEDPFKALERLRRNPYDIAILDINLPGMNGITLCEEMRKLPLHQKTPVIFVTSYTDFEPKARAILKGGDELISKPIMPVELTVKVITLLLKRRMQLAGAAI